MLRRTVAVAFEDPTLFSMSVEENLSLGRPPDDPATDAEIAEAVEIAAAQFVYDLPFGLDTRIGEQGMSLSGGQRQRLALAARSWLGQRCWCSTTPLSALDVHTEAAVTEGAARALAGVTTIVVAHRASTVLLADRVALLDVVDVAGPHPHHHPRGNPRRRVARRRSALPLPAGCRRRTDDGAEPLPVWESDDARHRLDHSREEAYSSALSAVAPPGMLGLRGWGLVTGDDDRAAAETVAWRGRFDESAGDLPIDESRSRRREALNCFGRCWRPTGRAGGLGGGRGKRCATGYSAVGQARHRPRHPAAAGRWFRR